MIQKLFIDLVCSMRNALKAAEEGHSKLRSSVQKRHFILSINGRNYDPQFKLVSGLIAF